ncbi:hypothetical protein [Stenotrophomonas maltophilia]|uniref:hypothetical protein n=1 Tax=Stenotrophomonas maltophilia TaxID=40324 RepID=UPI00128C8B9A|nr:hypothetical protein [Stenotrophomonas maltophilia]MBH1668524.1 hypothetical protein [Stenotrophomonas maltophilia]
MNSDKGSPSSGENVDPPATLTGSLTSQRRKEQWSVLQAGSDSPMEWVSKRLAVAAGALAAVYAFAYVLGYRYLSEYFLALGAPWAIDLYSPSAIAQIPSPFAVLMVAMGVTLVTHLRDFEGVTYRASLIAFGVGGVMLGVHFIIKWFFKEYTSYWLIGVWLFGVLGAFGGAGIFIRDTVKRHGSNHATGIVLTVLALAAFLGAPVVARVKARDVVDSGASGLPVVSGNSLDGAPWRLVRATPDGKFLVTRAYSGKGLEFRVIEATTPAAVRKAK